MSAEQAPAISQDRIPLARVTSSNISRIGYDEASQTLAVQFSNGTVFHYGSVSAAEHEALMKTESVGSYFARNIKSNKPSLKMPTMGENMTPSHTADED